MACVALASSRAARDASGEPSGGPFCEERARPQAHVVARAGVVAAVTWIVGMGFRFAFALYANTTGGSESIGRWSAHHAVTSGQVWTTALVLMAFAEVLSRVGIMQWRRWVLSDRAPELAFN